MRCKLVVAMLILCANSAFGQTASDLEAKYGKPVNKDYSVSEHIWMTPKYTADGQVCQMLLYPKGIPANPNHELVSLPFEELKNTLNQLVPLPARGRKEERFLGDMDLLGGGIAKMDFPYEKVEFTFNLIFEHGLMPVESIPAKPRKTRQIMETPPGYSPPETKPEDLMPSENDFSPSQSFLRDDVKIEWKDRKCAGK
jgi:hypothetical protein